MDAFYDKYGECEKVLHYIQIEYNYAPNELYQLIGIEELFQYLLHMDWLDPQDKESTNMMKRTIDDFFRDIFDRRKKYKL